MQDAQLACGLLFEPGRITERHHLSPKALEVLTEVSEEQLAYVVR